MQRPWGVDECGVSEVMREGEGRDHRWETGFILITRGKVESFKWATIRSDII